MINDPTLINTIIRQIQALSYEDLKSAIDSVDQQYSQSIELTALYINENNYTFSKDLNNYSNIHIKTKKSFFNLFKRDKHNIQKSLEAA